MSHLRTFPGNNIRSDFTRTIPMIGEIHHFIHVGAVFDLTKKIVIPASATIYLIGVPNGGTVHFHKENYTGSTGGFEVRLLEDVTFTGGTQITGQNRNRRLDNASTFALFVEPATVDISEATELYLIGVPTTAQPAFRGPSSGAETDEWVLKADTPYALEIKNLTNNPLTLYAELCWYETALLT
jgi:hypothetical protein